MAPPFIALDIAQFRTLLGQWQPRRSIESVHMHHTWRPDHAQYRGHESIVAMWQYHTHELGWSDIAQHVTIAPDGTIWTGRHWDRPPASATGFNGSDRLGPFMMEMIGDFDAGRDPFGGPQKEAALWVTRLVQDRFALPPESLRFHRDLHSPKSCPGTAIDRDQLIADLKALAGREPPAGRAAMPLAGSYDPVANARRWLAGQPAPAPEAAGAEIPEAEGGSRAAATARGGDAPDAATLSRMRPHLIDLWGARYSSSGIFRTDPQDVARIFQEEIPKRIAALPAGEKLPIVLYAHGGLVSEAAGLRIAANQVDWWNANHTYPLHFIWETGLLETLGRMIGIERALGARDLADWTDPAVERVVRAAGGGRVWGAMKYAAATAFADGAAGSEVVKQLAALLKAAPDRVSLHAVGHSAGSIFHSYLLPRLAGLTKQPPVETLCLLAPAITVAEYKARLDPLIGSTVRRLVMFTMAKDYERADTVTFAYRKSLLYLINRALEPNPDEPVLGLEESVRADEKLRRRFGLGFPAANALVVWSRTAATTGRQASQSTSHGGFDNDVPTMESVMRQILDLPDAAPLDAPFPPDTESRSAPTLAAPAAPATVTPAVLGGVPGWTPAATPAAVPAATAPGTATAPPGGAGRRLALCIGIDAYPEPARLSGCVADARAWGDALSGLGFAVTALHDGQATREGILQALSAMIDGAQAGDVLVFQYAGHGTKVDDLDGDEPDGKDEAIVPVNYADGQLIIDDDLRGVLSRLPEGASLTVFTDCCHSATNTRFAVGRPPADGPRLTPRYIVLPQEVVDRYKAARAGGRALRAAPGTREQMRWVAFAACLATEVAYESDGRGAWSVIAVPLLAKAGQISNKRFQELVTQGFGASPRQHPALDAPDGIADGPLLGGAGGGRALGRSADRVAAADALADAIRRLLG
ncbi:MAG: caspase family protein [Dongiaceae bacterium]